MTDHKRNRPGLGGGSKVNGQADHHQDSAPTLFGTDADGRNRAVAGMHVAELNSHQGARAAIDRIIQELADERVPFTSDTVRRRGGEPLASSANLMGARVSAAARAGIIECCGYTTSTRASRHNGVIRQWIGTSSPDAA